MREGEKVKIWDMCLDPTAKTDRTHPQFLGRQKPKADYGVDQYKTTGEKRRKGEG